jgi:signal transduction histidine kinase
MVSISARNPAAADSFASTGAARADSFEPPVIRSAAEAVRLRRRQLSHDIRHELGTITMLASLLSCAPDMDQQSRDRARQLLGETRWLDELHAAYEELQEQDSLGAPAVPAPIRLDAVTGEVVAAIGMATRTRINLTATETWAHADRLAYWRALRNILGNAVRAAGPDGTVEVAVGGEDGWAVARIDDDGPGFGEIAPGLGSLGLGIVQDMVAERGGELEIRRAARGGCCVRLRYPAATPHEREAGR